MVLVHFIWCLVAKGSRIPENLYYLEDQNSSLYKQFRFLHR